MCCASKTRKGTMISCSGNQYNKLVKCLQSLAIEQLDAHFVHFVLHVTDTPIQNSSYGSVAFLTHHDAEADHRVLDTRQRVKRSEAFHDCFELHASEGP
eukprot:1850626-Amphidinium_carterae.1